jgi:hypothetical protein
MIIAICAGAAILLPLVLLAKYKAKISMRNVSDMFERWFIPSNTISNKPTDWLPQYSTGVSVTSSTKGLWEFSFPSASGSVNYLTTLYKQNQSPKLFTLTFEVDSTFPAYQSLQGPNPPANFRLYFQRKWDDMSGADGYESYRWWASEDSYVLGSADGKEVTFSIPLTPGNWSNVIGQMGTAAPSGFTKALGNIGRVGMTFGGGGAFGHGVNVTAGSAKLTLKSVSIV